MTRKKTRSQEGFRADIFIPKKYASVEQLTEATGFVYAKKQIEQLKFMGVKIEGLKRNRHNGTKYPLVLKENIQEFIND